jgi:hypothetical protein
MGWFGLLVLLGLAVFGWFAFRELKLMESEILRDIEAKNAATAEPRDDGDKNEPARNVVTPVTDISLDGQLMRLISAQPGLVQTDLYSRISGFNRKQIQQSLLEMDRQGVIRRERLKGSYRIFPG